MKLIVGLGNPGRICAHNRHNVGFRCLNYFARLHSIRFDHRQCQARVGLAEVGGERLLLTKPRTFVNLSGKPVACLVRTHDIPLSDLLVIYDDLDSPLGTPRGHISHDRPSAVDLGCCPLDRFLNSSQRPGWRFLP